VSAAGTLVLLCRGVQVAQALTVTMAMAMVGGEDGLGMALVGQIMDRLQSQGKRHGPAQAWARTRKQQGEGRDRILEVLHTQVRE